MGAVVVRRGARFLAVTALIVLSASGQAAGPARPPSVGGSPTKSQTASSGRDQLPTFVNSEVLAILQAVSAQNQCMIYAYDHNGNITARTDQTFGAATWGSSVFGCFTWTAP